MRNESCGEMLLAPHKSFSLFQSLKGDQARGCLGCSGPFHNPHIYATLTSTAPKEPVLPLPQLHTSLLISTQGPLKYTTEGLIPHGQTSAGCSRGPEKEQGDGAELKQSGEGARERSPLLSDGKLLISQGRGSGDQTLTGLGSTEAAAQALARDSSLSCQGVPSQCRVTTPHFTSLCYIGPKLIKAPGLSDRQETQKLGVY